MAVKNLYFGVENIALTPTQRDTLVNGTDDAGGLRQMATAYNGSAKDRMQVRISSDSDKAIFEARFETNLLTVANVRQRLAALFGVPLAQITSATGTPNFGAGTSTVVTYSYQGTPRVRFVVFGGVNATWEQSNAEARAYLALFSADWNEAV